MKQRATAIAIATVLVAAGLSVAPPAMAVVGPDCDEEFLIPDSEPLTPRTLAGNEEETGREDVEAGTPEKVTVRLESEDDKLEFGVFYLDGQTCEVASDDGLTNCGDSEILDTVNNPAPEKQTCNLDDPSSGEREYYFHIVNQQDDELDYSIWMSS